MAHDPRAAEPPGVTAFASKPRRVLGGVGACAWGGGGFVKSHSSLSAIKNAREPA